MADVDKKQSNEHYQMLPVIAGGCCVVALVIAFCFIYQTFFSETIHDHETINVTVVDAKGHGKDLSAEGKVHVKEQLHTALMEVSEKAEAAYNEKFATLLTILTLFGVAWPIVIAFLQKMNLDEDRAKITEALEKYVSLSGDLQKQKTSNSEMIQTIERMSEDLQKQKKEISNLQLDNQIYFGAIQLKYADDFGPIFTEKKQQRVAYESSDALTRTFKILSDTWDTYYQGELLATSEKISEHDFPFFIKDVSNKIYNLVVNYNNINFVEVISYLDEIITNVDRLNQHNSSIIEAVRFLKCAKMILEQDYSKSSTEEKS